MKLWIDDVRPAPEGNWFWAHSAREVKALIEEIEWDEYDDGEEIELIDISHDAGKFASNDGDYIHFLEWLEETGRNYPIRIH